MKKLIFILLILLISKDVLATDRISIHQNMDNKIIATDPDTKEVIWEYPTISSKTKGTEIIFNHDQTVIFWGWGSYFFEIDKNTGKILNRIYTSDHIKSIEKNSMEAIILTLTPTECPDFTYTRTYQNGEIIEPVHDQLSLLSMHRESIEIIPDLFIKSPLFTKTLISDVPDFSKIPPTEVRDAYLKAIERDPTNPWHYFYLGQAYLELDDKEAAMNSFARARSSTNNIFTHLLIGVNFDMLEQSTNADNQYAKAYISYIEKGFIPDMATSLLPMIPLKTLAGNLFEQENYPRFIQIINWSKKFAPQVKFEYYFNIQYAKWLKNRGLLKESQSIKTANTFNKGGFMSGGRYLPLIADQCIFIMHYSHILFWIVLILFFFHYRKYKLNDLKQIGIITWLDKIKRFGQYLQYNTLTYLRQDEKILLIFIFLFTVFIGSFAITSIINIGKMASIALSLEDGDLGNPCDINHFENTAKWNNSDETLYTLAYAYQRDRRYDNALLTYRKIRRKDLKAKAYNNMGIIHEAQKRVYQAVGSYKKAIQLNKSSFSAYYNLGRLTSNPKWTIQAKYIAPKKIQFHERFLKNKPLIAPISLEERNEAILGAKHLYDIKLILPTFISILSGKMTGYLSEFSNPALSQNRDNQKESHNNQIGFYLYHLIIIILIFSLFLKPRKLGIIRINKESSFKRILQLFFPGLRHIEKGHTFGGILILYLCLWCWCVQIFFSKTGSPGILTHLAFPRSFDIVPFPFPIIPNVIASDPVWFLICRGTYFLLIGCYLINLIFFLKTKLHSK